MRKPPVRAKKKRGGRRLPKQLPVIIERGEDGFYVVECPILRGCYSQGKTMDEALRNIREVIELLLEEEGAREALEAYRPTEIGLHTLTL